jgi:pimeloyl-ACP methyl ester carboxylesterase
MARDYEFVTLQMGEARYHGLSTGQSAPLCLHVHGTWGNFYENPFVFQLTDTYVAAGYSYASTNNPGHDGGSMHEDFDASLPVLYEWISHLSPQAGELVLQGHSLGALKVMRLLTDAKYQDVLERIRAIILLSPFDLVAFYGGPSASEVERRRERVEEIVHKSGLEALVDSEIFDVWPISAESFLSATVVDGPWDLFPTRRGSAGKLAQIGKPIFVALGDSDFAQTPSAQAVAQIIRGDVPEASVSVIQGAPHNFASHENELGRLIANFLG